MPKERETLHKQDAHCIVNTDAILDEEVIQIGAGRSGSTAVWQILNHIYSKAWKAHKISRDLFAKKDVKIFFTYRDPRDITLSRLRTLKDLNILSQKDININSIAQANQGHDLQSYLCSYLKSNYKDILLIKYEDFFTTENSDCKKVINTIVKFAGISLSESELDTINSKVSKSNNTKIQQNFNSFHEGDHESGIHGKHIADSKQLHWRDLLNEDQLNYLNKICEADIKYFNY